LIFKKITYDRSNIRALDCCQVNLNIAVAVTVTVVIAMLNDDCAVVCTLQRAEINASDSSSMHNDVRIKVANVQAATFTAAGQYWRAPPAALL